MNKIILFIVVLIILIGALFLFAGKEGDITDSYTSIGGFVEDTVVDSDYIIESEQKAVVENGATLTVNGNLEIRGALECENGPLNIIVKGDLLIEDILRCNRAEDIAEGDAGEGIALVVEGSVTFGENALVVSNGHVQIVDSIDKLAKTQAEIEALYEEVAEDIGDLPRIGPFTKEEGVNDVSSSPETYASVTSSPGITSALANVLVSEALAQGATDELGNPVRTVEFRGKWYVGKPGEDPPAGLNIPTPPKRIKKILILFNFGPGTQVNLTNFTLVGPDGEDGDTSVNESCNAEGKDGKDAMRFRVIASNIKVNNFTLFPGDGGDGGQAVTKRDCYPEGIAAGGDGGSAGNIKMEASGSFVVEGTFSIWPGWSGSGGRAVAYAKDGDDGCPAEKGGDATSTGGKGADNKKKLTIQNVQGASNIEIGPVYAGDGGEAKAFPGEGGSGNACGCDGAEGGEGIATGAKGGDAKLTLAGAVGRTPGAEEYGGDGGDAEAKGATGGNGGSCDATKPGNNGAKGGDATPKGGEGGTGTNTGGTGNETEQAGNGGNGGDGCPEGKGGDKGIGNTLGNHGAKGNDGKNLCVLPKNAPGVAPSPSPDDVVVVPDEDEVTEQPKEVIAVIEYQGVYIPIDQLFISPPHPRDEFGNGCEEDHWHAEGPVVATDGTIINDPRPNSCGLGEVSLTPVMEIEL